MSNPTVTNDLAIVPDASEFDAMLAKVKAMTAEQRKADFDTCFLRMTENVLRLAAHVRCSEEAGESLDEFRRLYGATFTDKLRMVAYGNVDPLAVRRFHAKPSVLNVVARLPLPDQHKLAKGDRVEVLLPRPGLPPDTMKMDPLDMDGEQLRQVFDHNSIRDAGQQRAYLERRTRDTVATKAEKIGRLFVDRERKVIVVRRTGDYLPAEFRNALRELEK